MNRWTYVLFGAGALIVAVALAVVAVWPSSNAKASSVIVHDGGVLVGTFPAQQALDHVSDSVGFEVRGFREVPDGFQFTGARAELGPAGVESAQKFAVLVYTTGDSDSSPASSIEVQQTLRFTINARFSPIDIGVGGAEAFFATSGAGAHIYAVLTGDMGFLVTMIGPGTPAQDDAIASIRTLVD